MFFWRIQCSAYYNSPTCLVLVGAFAFIPSLQPFNLSNFHHYIFSDRTCILILTNLPYPSSKDCWLLLRRVVANPVVNLSWSRSPTFSESWSRKDNEEIKFWYYQSHTSLQWEHCARQDILWETGHIVLTECVMLLLTCYCNKLNKASALWKLVGLLSDNKEHVFHSLILEHMLPVFPYLSESYPKL